jgi:hypothetical protein
VVSRGCALVLEDWLVALLEQLVQRHLAVPADVLDVRVEVPGSVAEGKQKERSCQYGTADEVCYVLQLWRLLTGAPKLPALPWAFPC